MLIQRSECMKLKLSALAVLSTLVLSACNDAEEPSASLTTQVNAPIAPTVEVVVEAPIQKPEFSWDWEVPTHPYYTLGMSPIDPSSLVKQYSLDSSSAAKTIWLTMDNTVTGFCKETDGINLYSHASLYDDPEKATPEQSEAIDNLLKALQLIKDNCKALTAEMSDKLSPDDFTSSLAMLIDNNGIKEQSWFFENKEEGYMLVSTRDIEKPKGFTVRCKDDFSEQTLKPALSGITFSF